MSRIGTLERAARAIAARRADAGEDRSPAFVEGIVLGAVVGAAIAGSTLWSRLRRSGERPTRIADAVAPDPEAPD